MFTIASKLGIARRMPILVQSYNRIIKEASKRNQTNRRLLQSIDEKFNKVDAIARRNGKVSRKDVENIFNEIINEKVSPTASQNLLLIRCCGSLLIEEPPEVRSKMAQEIFNTISSSSKLDISHYNALLQVYLDNEFDFNPLDILTEIQKRNIEPNRVTYQRLILRYCQLGDIEGATKVLEFMKLKGFPVNEAVFNSLILGYGKAGDVQSAYGTLEIMRQCGLEPSSQTYKSLLCAYAISNKPEDIKKINELIEEAQKNEISLTDADIFEVIKILGKNDHSDLIEELVDKIPKRMGYNQECLRCVTELCNLQKFDIALKLYKTMKPSQFQMKNKTVGFALIRQLVKSNAPSEYVINFCNQLSENGANDYGLSKAAEIALSIGDVKNGKIYLKEYGKEHPLRPHYFWPILAQCKTEDEVFNVLSEDMVSLANYDYGPIHDTFVDYVWDKVTFDVDLFMEKCRAIGYSAILTFNSLLDYSVKYGKINQCANLISNPKYNNLKIQSRLLANSLVEAYCDNPDVKSTSKILKELLKNPARSISSSENSIQDYCGRFIISLLSMRPNDKNKLLTPILKEFVNLGLKISNNSMELIKKKFTISSEDYELLRKLASDELLLDEIDEFRKQRKDMSIEELEENLIELKSKGMNTRGVLRSLLLAHCRRVRFPFDDPNEKINQLISSSYKRVKEILKELEEEDYEFSNAMYASLFDFYVNCWNVDEALATMEKIDKNFVIDAYKIINLATVLVRKDRIEDVFNLLKSQQKTSGVKSEESEEIDEEQLTLFDNEKSGKHFDRSINRLLNAVIDQTKDPKLVKEAFDLSIKFSGSIITTLNTGPLVKVHITNGDYKTALEEYIDCAKKYNVVPRKLDLMRHFLEKSDSSSLQTVIDLSNSIHGEMNTLLDLASTCIDVGKIKQAKKLIETPGLRARQEKLDMICDKYVLDNKTNELEQFIQITKNLFDVDRDSMYYHLIKAYGKLNEGNKALNVWTSMQEENLQPSERTLRLLADVLQKNDIPCPFEVPSSPKFGTVESKDQIDEEKSLFNQLNLAIKRKDLDTALGISQSLESKGESVAMSQHCAVIDLLLNADRLKEAFNLAQSLLQNGQYPSPRILRFLLTKLASKGDYELIKMIEPKLPGTIEQTTWYTSILANAYINAGKASEFLDNILPNLKPFPLGGLLALLNAKSDLEEKILKIVNDIAEQQDNHLPQNMVWLYYMQNERYDDAKRLYDSNPKFKEFLLFTALLDKIRETKNVTMARKLIDTLSKSELTPKSIGIAYGAMIDILVDLKQIDECENMVLKELATDKPINIEHVNRTSLFRLINAIRENKQREPRFSLPQKTQESSNQDSGSSSSDDEVLNVKQK